MKSSVCIDASFIIRSLGGHPLSETALSQLEKWQEDNTTLIAPSHIIFEVTSVLRRFVYLKHFTPQQGEAAFEKFLKLDIRLSSNQKMLRLGWKLAKQFNRPRSYDTTYIALAQMRGCEFWTADKRIFNAVRDKLNWVKCL